MAPRMPQGVKDPRYPDTTQIVIRMEDELFADIRTRAIAQNVSFTEACRILLEWGLDAASKETAR